MDSPNSVEFTMKKKEDTRTALQRVFIFCACFLPALIILGIVISVAAGLFLAVTPVLLILCSYLCWYCMRFTRIEYEYAIHSGDFTVAAIYNNLSRKDLITAKVKDMHKIVPYFTNEPLLEAPEINQVLYYCSDLENPDLYIAVFSDEKKGRVALVFNTSRKLVQIMKFYNALNTVMKNDFQI
jgi:hypothetical protein